MENARVTTTEITIQNIPHLDIEIPDGYDKHIVVPASQFQNMCKDLRNVGSNLITVTSKGFSISFSCDADSVMKRTVEFGDPNESDDEDDEETYRQTFPTEQFTSIQKISGLASKLQIYRKMGLPLLIRANIGVKSYLSIYMYSNELKESIPADDSETE